MLHYDVSFLVNKVDIIANLIININNKSQIIIIYYYILKILNLKQ